MKKNNLLLVLSIILISFSINVQNVVAQETDPYTVYGTVKDENGVAVVGAIITFENLNTKEKNSVGNDTITGNPIQVTTDSDGLYIFELINLENSYSDGDEILVTAGKEDMIGSNSIFVNAGNWGAEVDIILGLEERSEEKDQWYASLSNPLTLLILLALIIAIILILILLKRRTGPEPEGRQIEGAVMREEYSKEMAGEEPEPDRQSTIIEESVAYECPECGEAIKEEDTSCSNCGVRFA